ncbi:XRE family transcriptional regulator [Amycolatopsis sp. CA-230715]|uniref:XRE family transcriptional regulator n=1 Tax=Amycolatopsis sp. CA-230715 TaxID=2745196 RepID=UPI001C0165D7|nr:XRE family transcriptional regulator [Amycolatopsis sp. CA-230715]QWF78908.1 hypothetical protein HUW46_02307 [Amycolatopsis sp. CA-230715]
MHAHEVTASEQEWLTTRAYLRDHRRALDARAAESHPGARVLDTALLASREWLPDTPIPLDTIDLDLDTTHEKAPDVNGAQAQAWLPVKSDGTRYSTYSQAVGTLAAPTVFEDRPTYRLLNAELHGTEPRLRFGLGSYFDSIDTGEAAAHELALDALGHPVHNGLRVAIGDPWNPGRRPVNLAISTLTIRRDRDGGRASFLLHWRDPRKVGHAGGMFQVVPVGVFQPSGRADWNVRNDFSLWRNVVRELAEEVAGEDEYDSEHAPIDYDAWPLATRLDFARRQGHLTAWCLGLGVDATSFATDLLTAVIIDAPVFDDLFGTRVTTNAEGRVLDQVPFTDESVRDVLARHPMQAAGEALLRLAAANFC